jgi:DNA-binding Lrp family transcriptional regulator
MAKSSKKQIDQDEKRVIEQLQRNSNESIDKIAKTCGFSRQKVWRIVKRLENKRSNEPVAEIIDGIIDGFKKYSGKNLGIFVQTACILQGEYDMMLCFTAKDISVAKRFTEFIYKKYSTYISDIVMLEDIFSIRISGMMNPKVDELREFFRTA